MTTKLVLIAFIAAAGFRAVVGFIPHVEAPQPLAAAD